MQKQARNPGKRFPVRRRRTSVGAERVRVCSEPSVRTAQRCSAAFVRLLVSRRGGLLRAAGAPLEGFRGFVVTEQVLAGDTFQQVADLGRAGVEELAAGVD